jgi:hypothetical protein
MFKDYVLGYDELGPLVLIFKWFGYVYASCSWMWLVNESLLLSLLNNTRFKFQLVIKLFYLMHAILEYNLNYMETFNNYGVNI